MSDLTPRRLMGVRIRRIASLVLSVASGIVAVSNLILLAGPWSVFTDGTFGMPPVLAFLVDSMPHTLIAAIAAVILAGTTGASGAQTALPADALPRRLPMILAIIACCMITAYYALPALSIATSLIITAVAVLIPSI